MSLGYPNLEKSIAMAKEYVKSGCDTLEVDFPSPDPYLDSPFIQERMLKALEACSDYAKYMEAIRQVCQDNPGASIILLAYEGSIRQIGTDEFAAFCLENGLRDLIYVGDHYPETRQQLIDKGLRISSYIRYHMPEEDLEAARQTNGFIYLQAKPGKLVNPDYYNLDQCIQHLRQDHKFNRPIYCGVGIATEEDVKMAREAGADGVFVGSTILKLHDDLPALRDKIRSLKEQTI